MERRKFTLVALLGTGQFKKDAGDKGYYIPTRYRFDDGWLSSPQCLVLQALFESKHWDIRKMVIIGTRTSAWAALVPDMDGKGMDLYCRILDETQKPGCSGILQESLEALRNAMRQDMGVDVDLFSHDEDFTGDNLSRNFEVYHGILDSIAPGIDVLMDVTHGFRSMSLLFYQTIQLFSHLHPDVHVEIEYGELHRDEECSRIRSLSNYWELFAESEAISDFTKKFDGMKLASLLTQHWSKGAKWIRAFSVMVINNTCLQIGSLAKQLGDEALKQYVSLEGLPAWVADVKRFLESLHHSLGGKGLAESLFSLAELYEARHMEIQAVMTLRICVETCILQSIGESVGDYKAWSERGWKELQDKTRRFSKEENDAFNGLREMRNKVAHGGGINAVKGIPLKFAERSGCLKTFKPAVQHLLKSYPSKEADS